MTPSALPVWAYFPLTRLLLPGSPGWRRACASRRILRRSVRLRPLAGPGSCRRSRPAAGIGPAIASVGAMQAVTDHAFAAAAMACHLPGMAQLAMPCPDLDPRGEWRLMPQGLPVSPARDWSRSCTFRGPAVYLPCTRRVAAPMTRRVTMPHGAPPSAIQNVTVSAVHSWRPAFGCAFPVSRDEVWR